MATRKEKAIHQLTKVNESGVIIDDAQVREGITIIRTRPRDRFDDIIEAVEVKENGNIKKIVDPYELMSLNIKACSRSYTQQFEEMNDIIQQLMRKIDYLENDVADLKAEKYN
jgi:CRISPR/Cas system CSM-associated protein Csm2 small subunit